MSPPDLKTMQSVFLLLSQKRALVAASERLGWSQGKLCRLAMAMLLTMPDEDILEIALDFPEIDERVTAESWTTRTNSVPKRRKRK